MKHDKPFKSSPIPRIKDRLCNFRLKVIQELCFGEVLVSVSGLVLTQVFCVIVDGTLIKVTSFLFKDLGELMPKRGEGMKK